MKLSKISPILYYCGENLSKVTYRLPRKEKNDSLANLRIFKRILFDLFTKSQNVLMNHESSRIAIYDGDMGAINLRSAYIKHYASEECRIHISRDGLLYNGTVWFKIKALIVIGLFIFPIGIFSMFSANHSGLAFLIREYLETSSLLKILKNNQITKLHFFCIYERDANICAHILIKNGIFVNKIPSEVPLHFFNKTVVASCLSFCFPYQKEELKAYANTMFVSETSDWGPETILNAPVRFLDLNRKSLNKAEIDIGFYSSGNWLREHLGDADLGHNDKANEELLLQSIIDLAQKKQIRLMIYLHPIEKRSVNKMLTENYYVNLIKSPFVQLSEFNSPSIESFDKVNLAVSLYSTLMFERIYLGFKTLLAPWGYPEFPLKNSTFENVCISGPKELEEKIDFNLKFTNRDFFTKNNISKYSNFVT